MIFSGTEISEEKYFHYVFPLKKGSPKERKKEILKEIEKAHPSFSGDCSLMLKKSGRKIEAFIMDSLTEDEERNFKKRKTIFVRDSKKHKVPFTNTGLSPKRNEKLIFFVIGFFLFFSFLLWNLFFSAGNKKNAYNEDIVLNEEKSFRECNENSLEKLFSLMNTIYLKNGKANSFKIDRFFSEDGADDVFSFKFDLSDFSVENLLSFEIPEEMNIQTENVSFSNGILFCCLTGNVFVPKTKSVLFSSREKWELLPFLRKIVLESGCFVILEDYQEMKLKIKGRSENIKKLLKKIDFCLKEKNADFLSFFMQVYEKEILAEISFYKQKEDSSFYEELNEEKQKSFLFFERLSECFSIFEKKEIKKDIKREVKNISVEKKVIFEKENKKNILGKIREKSGKIIVFSLDDKGKIKKETMENEKTY